MKAQNRDNIISAFPNAAAMNEMLDQAKKDFLQRQSNVNVAENDGTMQFSDTKTSIPC